MGCTAAVTYRSRGSGALRRVDLRAAGTPYDQLPDYFIAYDIFDPDQGFLASDPIRDMCDLLGIAYNPVLQFTPERDALLALASGQSLFANGQREGIYCRIEENGRCVVRAKLVRHGYRPRSDEDWKQRGIVTNKLR